MNVLRNTFALLAVMVGAENIISGSSSSLSSVTSFSSASSNGEVVDQESNSSSVRSRTDPDGTKVVDIKKEDDNGDVKHVESVHEVQKPGQLGHGVETKDTIYPDNTPNEHSERVIVTPVQAVILMP